MLLRFQVVSVALVVIFLNEVLSDDLGAGIPTKEQQRKIIKEVEELFNDVKILVTEEGVETDAAVIQDTQITADRGLDYLAIMKEFALLKLSCSSPSADCDKVKEQIEYVSSEGEQILHYCVNEAVTSVYNNTQVVTAATDEAMNKGKLLLETLNNCTTKPGLQQIGCYRSAITLNGLSLKSILLDTMHIHRTGHLESIAIRQKASECVDETLTICHDKLSEILGNASATCA